MKRVLAVALITTLLTACSGDSEADMAVRVSLESRTFTLQARGDIVASETIPINVPFNVRMQLNIEWLIPEFSNVSKGDVVARFEDSDALVQQGFAQVQIANQSLAIRNHRLDSETGLTAIDHQSQRVDGETVIAQTFADFDPRYFSRVEIIDAIGDLNYLGVESSFYDWQSNTHESRTDAETARIQAEKSSAEQNLMRQNTALEMMEMTSPADGIFVYGRTPWGRKVNRGQPVFPGGSVGMLPVAGKVHARIYVPKSDAVGLEAGQSVRFRLDSNVHREVLAVVESVSPMATPKTRDDPRRYIVVLATVDEEDAMNMRVGTALTATIITAEIADAIVLPQQAVFSTEEESVVYVIEGGDLNPRVVTVGHRSPTLVEVVDGLSEGERVSLVAPQESGA